MKIGTRCERDGCDNTDNLFSINGRTFCVECCDFAFGKVMAPVKEAVAAARGALDESEN